MSNDRLWLARNYFEHFPDPCRDFYVLSQEKIKTNLKLDLTDLLYYKVHPKGKGGQLGLEDKFFFNEGFNLFFSKTIENTLDGVFTKTYNVYDLEQLTVERDFSTFLNIRRQFQFLGLFEDAEYEVQFLLGDYPITAPMSWSYIKNMTSVPLGVGDLPAGKFYLRFSLVSPSKIKPKLDFYLLSHRRVLSDIWRVFNRLCQTPHYFKYLSSIFKKVKGKVPEFDFSSQDLFYSQWKSVSLANFNKLDFFDWTEVMIGFSMLGSYKKHTRAHRMKMNQQLRDLTKTGVFKILLSNKTHSLQDKKKT